MRDLVESILLGDNVEASKLFESHMESIVEKKLYEAKRCIDISEVVKPVKGKPGEFTGQNTKADWAKYRKQHPAAGMYDVPGKRPGTMKKGKPSKQEKTASGGITKHGIEARRKKGYLQAHPALKSLEFIKKVTQYHKTGKIDESVADEIAKASKQQQAAAREPGAYTHGKTTDTGTPRDISAATKSSEKKKTDTDVTTAMKQVIRGMHRKKKDTTKGLIRQGLKTVITGKTNSGRKASRVTAAQRVGALVGHKLKQAAKTDTGRVATAVGKGAAHAWSQSLSKGMTGPLEE